jgi:hypothetical protein
VAIHSDWTVGSANSYHDDVKTAENADRRKEAQETLRMSNVECRIWSENPLDPVKMPINVDLLLPGRKRKQKNGATRYYSNKIGNPTMFFFRYSSCQRVELGTSVCIAVQNS